MGKIKRNTLLKYIDNNFIIENFVFPERIYKIKGKNKKGKHIVYLCEREIRAKDNFAVQFCKYLAEKNNLQIKIIHPRIIYDLNAKQNFIDAQILQAKKCFNNLNLDFEIIENSNISDLLYKIGTNVLVKDFSPIVNKEFMHNPNFDIYEIDGHNIVPARFISSKCEYSAATLRIKVYKLIGKFLTEYQNEKNEPVEADYVLKNFIKQSLTIMLNIKMTQIKMSFQVFQNILI